MQYTIDQLDALQEIINIGVGHGANALHKMSQSLVRLQPPLLEVLTPDELQAQIEEKTGVESISVVDLPFRGSFSGTAELVIPSIHADKLVTKLINEGLEDLTHWEVRAGTLTEVGNVVLNAVMGTISNLLRFSLRYSMPCYMERNVQDITPHNLRTYGTAIIFARTPFGLEDLGIQGNIILFIEVASFDKLLTAIDNYQSSLGVIG
ncbi:MAG: chemotaxis protein CheC [Chloroflexota bacterium]|nr:chemotaxis protein CheC [Chloroflexota bacterium]